MFESSFFSQFLMVTDFKTILFIAVLLVTFVIVNKLGKKKVSFSMRAIIATIIGLALGIIIQLVAGTPDDPSKVVWLQEVTTWYGLFGSGFMALLKMLVVPIVFVTILRVIINMKDGENIKSMAFRTIGMLLGTTALAAVIGIVVGKLMHLGEGFKGIVDNTAEMREVTSIVDTLIGLLPTNPVQAMADANIVAVIIFAAFIGLAVKRLNKKHEDIIKPFVDLVEAFYKIMVSVAMTVISLMPYAVVAMLANTVASGGIGSLLSVLEFVVALYISAVVLFVVHLIILALNGVNPIKYVKNAIEPLVLAFTSRSSLGTLPVTINNLVQKQGVEESVSSFAASLGANMGMNGCAGIYPALMAVTIANIAGVEMNFTFYAMLFIVITIGSIGIAGLPGTATMAVAVVISGVGLGPYFPLAAGILAIDPILDMGRTMLNVNGSMVTSIVVGKSLGKVNKNPHYEDGLENKEA